MKLNFKFQKPDMVAEAAKTGGKNVFLEILIFLGVFFVAQMAMSFPITIVMMPLMFMSEDYMAAAASGDYERITEASMDLAMSTPMLITQLFATVLMTATAMLFCKLIQKRKMTTLGFKKPGMWKEYGIGMLIGFGMMAGIVLIGAVTGALELQFNSEIASASSIVLLLTIFVGFLFQGMSEEVLCRSYFIISIARRKNQIWLAIIVSSVAFAALHLGNPGITALSLVNLTLFGILAGVYFIKRGNIWGIAAYHTMWNYVQGNVYGIKVSGLTLESSIFAATINEEMTILNGGSFGIEGGILTTIFQVVAIIILLCTKQKDYVTEETTEE